MCAVSRFIGPVVSIVGICVVSGCTFTFPILATTAIPEKKTVGPYDRTLNGSRVTVDLRSGRSITGLYSDWSEADAEVADGYGARYRAAVKADSALGRLPVPGDTLRLLFRDRTSRPQDAQFMGVPDPARPGVYVQTPSGAASFVDARALATILDADGAPVPFRIHVTLSGVTGDLNFRLQKP